MCHRQLQNANKAKDTYYKTRHWAQQHKLCLPQAPLPQPVLDVIEEWFFLVDDDGSGSLDAEELEAAFTVRPPSVHKQSTCSCTPGSISATGTSQMPPCLVAIPPIGTSLFVAISPCSSILCCYGAIRTGNHGLMCLPAGM